MKHRNGLICGGLALCCIAIYGQTLAHDFILCDDPLYVTENAEVMAGLSWENLIWAFTTERAMYMHPLTWLSHMLDCSLYGLRPWGHHLTNLLFHSLNAMVLFLVLARMTKRVWPSALVAVLFAVHPLHVESVAWIAERKDVLSMLFWTLGLGAYAWYRERPGAGRYLATTGLFFLGLMSKPMVVTFPFVLLLLDYWPLGQVDRTAPTGAMARKLARLAVEKIPLFLLTAAMCAVTMVMQMRGDNLSFGAKVPFLDRCANAAVVYVLYLVKTVWPSGLAVFYPHPLARPAWQVAGALVVLAAVTLVCLREMRRRPYLLVGWLWYLGTLVPVIELVQAGSFSHADRYTYIPLTGIFIMAAFGLDELCQAGPVPRRAVILASILSVCALTAAAAQQTAHWKNNEVLFRHALAVTPDNAFSRNNLGWGLFLDKKRDAAFEEVRRAVRLDPKYSLAIENLALLLNDEGRHEEALAKHREALALKPGDARAQKNLKVTQRLLGRLDTVEAEYRTLASKETKSVDDFCRLGALAMTLGDPEASSEAFAKASQMDPGGKKVNLAIADVLAQEKKLDDALRYYEKALDADPQDAQTLYNMGVVLSGLKRPAEAAEKYREALRRNEGFAQAHNNLGSVLANMQQLDEAVEHYRRAIALDPNYVQAHTNLAALLAYQGQADEAVQLYKKAVALNPESAALRLSLARLLIKGNRGAEAGTHLRKVLEIDPGNGEARALLDQTGTGMPTP